MKKIILVFFTICILSSSFGQSRKKDQEVDIIDHPVQLGESVRMISKKYLVDPAEIYKLNKFAVEGISQGMVLKIPVPRKEGASPKEKESRDEVVTQNESNKPEEKVSEPVKSEAPAVTPKNDIKKIVITERKTEINHKVLAKETLFSLARQYNVSVDEIKTNNPEVAQNGLKIGQMVKIPTSKTVDIEQSTEVNNNPPVASAPEKAKTEKPKSEPKTQTKPASIPENNVMPSSETIRHKVEPKETLYSLSRKYNVTVDEIKSQNQALLKNGLQIGQVLTIKTNN
ncbi:LysM peptidoglycan-binding domain-containing protein [Flavobacterium sp. CYK-4]|uniref:LysM peptidoglycan-binding domain-containing protein n=1 Tax=Flavobacterium lotistagni TaxID=2709660 RepID=UPI00140B86E7|nr:LysM peptidoglycan-binding domain-containing protein [Flavobacterium lotistagni]NHM07768.1 LysM peptidoglycan-binding domain-containing protein [Flavobacterium lotistagni]